MINKFNIALVQIALNGSPEKNLEKSLTWVRKAVRQGGQVICLPELYRSVYFCQKEDTRYFDLAEPLHQTSYTAFSALAKELGAVIIVPFFEKRAAGVYHNSAYIIDSDGSQAGLYRKMHIPDDPWLLREVLLHSGGSRVQGGPHGVRENRNPHLLGPVVSRGCPHHGPARCPRAVLPHGDRLAPA